MRGGEEEEEEGSGGGKGERRGGRVASGTKSISQFAFSAFRRGAGK